MNKKNFFVYAIDGQINNNILEGILRARNSNKCKKNKNFCTDQICQYQKIRIFIHNNHQIGIMFCNKSNYKKYFHFNSLK